MPGMPAHRRSSGATRRVPRTSSRRSTRGTRLSSTRRGSRSRSAYMRLSRRETSCGGAPQVDEAERTQKVKNKNKNKHVAVRRLLTRSQNQSFVSGLVVRHAVLLPVVHRDDN